MKNIHSLLHPFFHQFALIMHYLRARENNTPEIPKKSLALILKFEHFTIWSTFIGTTLFILFTSLNKFSTHYHALFSYFLLVLVITWTYLKIKIPNIRYRFFYSSYYFILFNTTIYLVDSIKLQSDLFVLAVYFLYLFAQLFRPGKLIGIPLIVFFDAHFWYLHHTHINDYYSLQILFLISCAILLIKTLFYYIMIDYLMLKIYKDRETKELILANSVHNNFFPEFQENDHLRFYSYRKTNSFAGGDFYDFVHSREGNMGFFFTDISGHGISSAMMSAALKMMLRNTPYHDKISPEHLLTALDHEIHESYTSHHATAVYIYFDFMHKKLHIGNAGHPLILHSRKHEPFQEIQTTGAIIGYQIREPIVDQLTLPMHSGERFLIYTDGLLDFDTIADGVNHEVSIFDILEDHYKEDGNTLLVSMVKYIEEHPTFSNFRDDVMIGLIEIK